MQLGCKAKDRITGFEGTVVAAAQYISGCNQILLAPPVDDKGVFRDSHWFDEQRCVGIEGDQVVLDNGAQPGFDKAAPKI